MVRHMVLFRFRPEILPGVEKQILQQLAELPAHYPAMERFGLGPNESDRDQTFSHVMTMEFAREEDLHSYLKSERHEKFVSEVFKPNVVARVIATYFVPS